MIDIQNDSKQLLEAIKKEDLNDDTERPVDPTWLRKQFPNDGKDIEVNLHIIEWKDLLNSLCDSIKNKLDSSTENYDVINRDAKQIKLANDIEVDNDADSCYFDTEAPLDEYSSYITYPELVQRAKDYQGPKAVEKW